MISHQADTFSAPSLDTTLLAAKIMITNPTPARNSPSANLAGLDRSPPGRFDSLIQVTAATGANSTTKKAFTDWNQVAGTSKPPTCRSVKSRAKRFSDVGACSNADQKVEIGRAHVELQSRLHLVCRLLL